MAFLNFNKAELVNLSYSLKREIICANKTGAYCNTSIVTCNTRRYHGLLGVPVDNFGGSKEPCCERKSIQPRNPLLWRHL